MKNSEKGMKKIIIFWVIGLNMSMAASLPVAKAGLTSVIGGTSAPVSTLGPYAMTSFADDKRPSYLDCSYVTSPFGNNITFNIPLKHHIVSEDWLVWSHDYKGDVYWTGQNDLLVTLTMPSGTTAFYFYAQPQNMAVHTITAIAFDGISDIVQMSLDVSGNNGASYYGFYGTDGSIITKIKIYSKTADFAIGEFGIAMIPVPEAFLLGNIGLSAVLELKRQHIL
jgi:hypothetical protein